MKQLPAGWEETTLGEIADITMGQSPKWETYNDKGDGIPFYQWITEFWEKFVRIKTYSSQPIKIVEPNTILFSVRAPVWKINITKHKACIGRWNAWLFMKNKEQEFLFYLLKYLEKQFLNRSSGTVFDSINRTEIENLPIHLPPLPEQQAIAAVLSSFDDKIELLRAENQTLEQMGQELFKERFGKWKVGDELPEGWRVGKLGEIAEITSWKRPSEISDTRNSLFEIPLIWATKVMGYVQNFLFDGETLVIGRVWTHWEVQIFYEKIHPSDNTLVIKSNNFYFTYFILKSIDYEKINRGAVQPLITQSDLKNYLVILPDQETLSKFDLVIKLLFNKIRMNSEQIQTLSATRDQLLPKLMSWEVRVEF